MKIYLYLLPPR